MPRYLACELPPELELRLFAVSTQLRQPAVSKEAVDEAAWVMLQLVELTLDFYFLQSVERLKFGSFGHTTARLGIKTAQGGMSMIINRLIHRLSKDQLPELAEVMEGFVLK
jgi:hypothetical protein